MKKICLLFLLFLSTSVFAKNITIDEWEKIYDVNDWGENKETYSYGIFEKAKEVKTQTDCLILFGVKENDTSITLILPGQSYLYKSLLSEENKVVTISYRNTQKEDSINARIRAVSELGKDTAVEIVPLRTGTVQTVEPMHGFRDIFKMFLTNKSFDLLVKTNLVQVKTTFKGIELNNDNIEVYLLMAVVAPDVECVKKVFKLQNDLLLKNKKSEIFYKVSFFAKMHVYDFMDNKWLDNTDERNEILNILEEHGLKEVEDTIIDWDAKIYKSYQY